MKPLTSLSRPSEMDARPRAATVAELRNRLAAPAVPHEDRAPIWESAAEPSGGVPTSSEAIAAARRAGALSAELESHVIAVIVRPASPGESHSAANEAREHALRAMFATLTPIDAYRLRRRLEADRRDDALATAFRRLVVERRTRLLAVLANPRRPFALTRSM